MRKKALKNALKIGILIIIVIVFVLVNDTITEDKKKRFKPIQDSGDYAYQIEKVFVEDDYFVVKGWFFELEKVRNVKKDIPEGRELGIVLYDLNSDSKKESVDNVSFISGIPLKMEYQTRIDVNQYFECEYDYSHCGFVARVKIDQLQLDNEYQIVFKPSFEDDLGIMSNAFLTNGKLSFIRSEEHIDLENLGTDLEKIVNEGICVASCPDHSIYVFQHEWSLYWIAGEDYEFDEKGSTYIQFEMNTTQFDKLPKNRTENGWYWSNIGGEFEKFEITNELNCGKYRVSKRDMPTEYSVVYISTGYYVDDTSIWNRHIRPIYSFK